MHLSVTATYPPSSAETRAWWAVLGASTLLLLVVAVPLLTGHAVGLWDIDNAYFPRYVLWADAIRSGQLVLWDPWTHAGIPAYASPEIGTFSPVSLAIAAIAGGTGGGFIAYWLANWWAGAAGMILLARHLGAPPWGALVVVSGFLVSGIYIGHAEHTSIIAGLSLLPWIVWRLDDAVLRGASWPAVQAGALWGLSALSGYPGVAVANGLFAGGWAVGRAFTRGDSRLPRRQGASAVLTLGRLALPAVFVGGLVAAAPYVAFLYEGVGPRVDPLARQAAIGSNALSAEAVVTFASPALANLKLDPSFSRWRQTDISSVSVYTGAFVIVLMVTAVLQQPRSLWRWWVVGLSALGLACAVGDTLPVRGWLYDLVYPTRLFRHSALFRGYAMFGAAALALMATTQINAGRTAPRPFVRLTIAAVLCLVAAVSAIAVVFGLFPYPQSLGLGLPLWHAGLAWGGAAAMSICALLVPAVRRRCGVWFLAVALLDAMLAGLIGAPTLYDERPASLARWARLSERHDASLDLLAAGQESMRRIVRNCDVVTPCDNDQLILKRPVLQAYLESEDPHFTNMRDHTRLMDVAVGAQRAWFAASAMTVAPTRACLEAVAARAEAVQAPVIVLTAGIAAVEAPGVAASRCVADLSGVPAAQAVPQHLSRYDPTHLFFEVTAPEGGWLLVSDRWSRSWTATVNGQAVPIARGNFVFRAVPVVKGPNTVAFVFRPSGILLLVALSWSTLAVVSIGSLWRGRAA